MRYNKKIYISIFLCIFFMYFGIMLQDALICEISRYLKIDNINKVSVVAKNSNVKNCFTLSDINFLKTKLNNEDILAMGESKEKLYYGKRTVDSKVVGVSPNFNQFYEVNISQGSFFNESLDKENEFCVVLEDRLAYKLFGNENVKGLKVKILDKDFKIIGVVKRDATIIQNISDDGFDKVYIPIETLMKLDEKAQISYLQFKNFELDKIEKSKDKVIELLTSIGRDYNQYKIIDYNREKKLMEQKPLLVIFMLGGLCIGGVIKYLKKLIREIRGFFTINIKKEYLLDIVKNNKKNLLGYVFKVVFASLSIFILWNLIKFEVYIPSKYVPDEIIDIAYYKDIIQDGIRKSINNRIFLNSFIEIKFEKTNMFIDILAVTVILSSFIFNSLIVNLLNISEDITLVSGYCAKCSIITLILITFIFTGLKVPVINNFNCWIIIYLFLFERTIIQGVKIGYM